jgi:putative oxidoreductase
MQNYSNVTYIAGRALLGGLFFISGINKIVAFSSVAAWMSASGVPAAELMLAATIGIEVLGGLMLIIGYQARLAAIALALFLMPVTVLFHGFWSAGASDFQNQLTQFLKNLAILGGMLLVIEREQAVVRSRSGVTALQPAR